ncbi:MULTISPECIES: hypothetical protein [unclassified Massilia]|uniref:hypothetical protein n=1 Tax=unclassified Massilia TaxID=2609279 RepID=UPI0017836572|nr:MULTISPECIES: hypothetical protein [unclassified Massilia]MBD8528861.1 hypothetical protein [Massilia sp. CFBP 13647]MBD8673503.1 hypothetical protein [Massilia sp. CFBP 13721]
MSEPSKAPASPPLPPLLQPWAAWLSLFPDDLAATLGQMLLRLQPLVGPLRRHAARIAVEPAGVGDIVRRGSYDRLLISEWALADSVPDEFLRRAANGELLFTGPEPANSETSLRSIALFDAGPAQLGEPRLAHLALFILLARRAELAGAEFRWGILQQPGVLREEGGAQAVRSLLDARSVAVLDAAGLDAWNAALEGGPLDCWLVGDAASPRPAQVVSRVLVRRSWFAAQLEVELIGRRHASSASLPLPAPQDGVRLLRRPFDKAATAVVVHVVSEAHSLKRAPMFSNLREWLALGTMDGGVTVYRIPDRPGGVADRPGAKPGRPRKLGKPAHHEAIVAAGLHRKSFGTVALSGGALHFAGFPGPIFSKITLPLPDPDMFEAVPGALRWASAFYWSNQGSGGSVEDVLVLDKAGRLVHWTCSGAKGRALEQADVRLVARDVIGAIQQADRVLFAVTAERRTDVYSIARGKPAKEHLYPIMHGGRRLLFGETKEWRGGRGTYALQLDGNGWLVGNAAGADRVEVPSESAVIGCGRSERAQRPGLLVLNAGRTRISLLGAEGSLPLLKETEPIAQASFDPAYGRLAWVGQKSGALIVRGIDAAQPLLRIVPKRGTHD